MKDIKKFLICVDKFKGTFTSLEAGKIIADVLKRKFQTEVIPLADGGDGTLEALNYALKGKIYSAMVKDPLGRNIAAKYSIAVNTAIIEMAQSSGLMLLKKKELDPVITSTYGLGQLIRKSLDKKVKKIYIGLGGSATNDAGAGMLQALGVKFLDRSGNELLDVSGTGFGAYILDEAFSFDLSFIDNRIFVTDIIILSDVKNSLTGRNGTSMNYSYQKGGDADTAKLLESYLKKYKKAVIRQFKINPDFPGSGAAGGLAASIHVFLKGRITNGIDEIISLLDLEDHIKSSDCIITGEGSVDYQTAYGKAPVGIAAIAKKYDKPVIVIAGRTGERPDIVFNKGIDVLIKCFDKEYVTPFELKSKAEINLKKAAKAVFTVVADFDKYKNKIISYDKNENICYTPYTRKRTKNAGGKRV